MMALLTDSSDVPFEWRRRLMNFECGMLHFDLLHNWNVGVPKS